MTKLGMLQLINYELNDVLERMLSQSFDIHNELGEDKAKELAKLLGKMELDRSKIIILLERD